MTRAIFVVSLTIALSGCAHERSLTPSATLPEAYSAPGSASEAPTRWWQSFEDPALNALVDRVLTDNLQLTQAWARVDQASALRAQQASAFFPQVNVEGTAARNRSPDFFGNTAHTNQFGLSAAASYEVDLWGRIEAADDAAQLDALAGTEDLQSIATSLVSQVTETWFQLIETHATLALLDEQVATNEQFLELVELRFSLGQARAVDVYQQRQQLLSIRSQIPLFQSRAGALERALALLLGTTANAVDFTGDHSLPEIAPVPPTGLPSQLVEHRADLRAARLRVAAQDRRIAAAIANRFPTLRLTGSTGYQEEAVEDLLDNWIWTIAASLVAPVFDGGRRAAEVERQKAVLDERLAGYSLAMLTAFKEVEDALDAERYQRLHVTVLEAQLEVSRHTLRESRTRYTQGLTDYLPVIQALSTLQNNERNLIAARRQLLSYRVQLHRALGGRWTEEISR
jgi:NodT family efflux transporter outer membrane factor (OMF) lipoprotein